MSKQPEALRLAGLLEKYADFLDAGSLERDCAAELRRQHALIAELLEALGKMEQWVRDAAEEDGEAFDWQAINKDEGAKARAAIAKARGAE